MIRFSDILRRAVSVGTSLKAVAAAAAVFLCAPASPAATNTLDHVPYTTGMWSVTDWFGFGSLSNALTRLTAVEATTNAVAETDPVAVPLVSVLSTGKVDVAVLLNVSNVLGSAVSVLDTGKVSQAQWVAGSNSFATAAQGAKADTALQPADTNGWTTTEHQAWLTNETSTLQSVVTRGGTVTSGTVTIDADGVETNTYGGRVSVLGNAVKSRYATLASGSYGATALGWSTTASGNAGATALGRSTTASGNDGATALGWSTTASGSYGATALGWSTTASGSYGATA